ADRVRSPLALYGKLEIGIGLYALAVGPLVRLAGALYGRVGGGLGPAPALLVKLLLSALVLVPPCALMGATLPALLRAVSASAGEARRAVGLLYGLNLLGALTGALATGFILLEAAGIFRTTLGAAVVNVLVGGGALLLARRGAPERRGEDAAGTPEASPALLRFAFLGLFVSGAVTLGLEVVFTRVLGLVFGVSSYAFALTLAVFLLGLGLGALAQRRLALRGGAREFAAVSIAVAAAGGCALLAVPGVPRMVLYLRQIPGLGFWQLLFAKGLLAAALLLPLAALAGLSVPLLLGLFADDLGRLGGRVGAGYLVNTAGTVAGSLATGFLLVPVLGTEGALKALLLLAAATGLLGTLLFAERGLSRLAGAAAATGAGVLVVLAARWSPLLFLNSDTSTEPAVAASRVDLEQTLRSYPNEVLFFREGRDATIGVTQTPNVRSLVVNGHPDGSDSQDMSTEVMLGVIPLAAHPRPESVLVIGFGTGVTARAAVRVPETKRVDVLEIERAVLDAAPFFAHVNGGVEKDPKVTLVRDDARAFLAAPPRKWDAIISEPSNPWRAGVAGLYTEEFFHDARRALEPGGVFAQWMHLYGIDDATLRVVFKTIATAFPGVEVFWLDEGNVVILASETAPAFDSARVARLLDGEFASDRVRWARLGTASELYGRFLLGTNEVRAYVRPEDPVHTDDHPVLELRAPRGLFTADGQNPQRLLAAKLDASALAPKVIGPAPPAEALWLAVAEMYLELDRKDEAAEATRRAMEAGGPLARIRAADLQMKSRDMAGAAKQLEALQAVKSRLSPDEARELAYAEAHFFAATRRIDEATAAYQKTGEIEGTAGVELLSLLAAEGRKEPAFALAERLLGAAHLGGPMTALFVKEVSALVGQLGDDAASAARAASLVERLPEPARGYPRLTRLKVLMLLYEKLSRPADVLRAAEEIAEMGILDSAALSAEARALRALGRAEEAARAEARLAELGPRALARPVASPLLTSPGSRARSAPPGRSPGP
ncbi:MAG TPA: methyltransferase, partial [Thermoanaerobaculia bacterium]|nr:methyltransferase [Thermoanaerobaculia bacterium]